MTTVERTLISPWAMKKRRGKLLYWLVFALVITLFTVAFVVPLLWMVLGAMKTAPELARNPPTLLPESFGAGAYTEAWEFMDLAKYFTNTVIIAAGAWLIQLAVQVPAAYALSKLRPALGRWILALMLATLMLPASALLVPTYLAITEVPIVEVNLVNSPAAIWLPAAANAFNIYLLKRFFDQIPTELLDAARIDGAGSVTTMWRIVLPLSRPIIAVVSIFSIVAAWKDFIWPLLVLQDPEIQTLSVALQRFEPDTPINLMLAGLVLASIPMVVAFLIFQRQILAGLTAGSLKG
ncbi:carbohydrate ABC transporter permease [Actinophytocola algeriensis]|uniref:Multiple sugar transport system permease protein n=1 Tax=Actinophytocola algeriensis TaxID=1768010 RepID=A0A7W7VF21_9PSEU|nr:carbohydrate ABC transporter permease [Actinophytocola algeriensis]MBB4907842.1 multiple sugar transport system permease protein [Actinophytocola algeriensis]MBE1479872.1 multiple sugar transport system permease protein [Actinophytocola algeriensis]